MSKPESIEETVEVVRSLYDNKTKGQWKMLAQPKNGFSADGINAGPLPFTKNFGGRDYDFEFETGHNQKCTKIAFAVTDVLMAGATDTPVTANHSKRRSFNSVACLFNQLTVEINNTQVDNIPNICEVDSYAKRSKYTQAYMDGFGKISNLHSDAIRATDSQANTITTKLWIPDGCPMLCEESIPQNCRVKITLKSDTNYALRAVHASNIASTEGIGADNYRYGVTSLRMYYFIEDSEAVKANHVETLDYRPYTCGVETLTGIGQQTKNYTIKPTTYEIGIATVSSIRSTNVVYAPSVFAAANTAQNLKNYQIDYAGQQFPTHTISNDFTAGTDVGHALAYLESMISSEKNVNDAGGIDYDNFKASPFYKFDVYKLDGDMSTAAAVTIEPGGNSSDAQLFLFQRYGNIIRIYYNNIGAVSDVKREY